MSVKAMSLVWDMVCPATWNNLTFSPSHKFVLLAYADHADHNGRNIYPAVATIQHKTGYSERNIQYLTRGVEQQGILLPDGQGPRGTNKWRLAYDAGGAKIAPVQFAGGANDDQSLGAKLSGARVAPELTEQDIYISMLEKKFESYDWWKKLEREISHAPMEIDNGAMVIHGLGQRAEVLTERYHRYIERALVVSSDLRAVVFME